MPSVDQVIELAQFFGTDELPALIEWVLLQIDSEKHKKIFSDLLHNKAKKTAAVNPAEKQAPGFENTWVFGRLEMQSMKKNPWFLQLLQCLSFAYPHSLSFKELGFQKENEFDEFVNTHLNSYIEQGKLLRSKGELKILYRHMHIPRAPEWYEMRSLNIARALNQVNDSISPESLQNNDCYREIVTRTLSEKSARAWVDRLKEIEKEFVGLPYDEYSAANKSKTLVYSLITHFAERKLSLKKE